MRHMAWNYAFATFAVALAAGVTLVGGDFLAQRPLVPFYLAVLVVVLSYGSGPGLFATLLSLITAKYFFLPTPGSTEINETGSLTRMLLFTVLSLALCLAADVISRRKRGLAEEILRESEDALPSTL